ncbi:MAG: crossover junction endodeoxyribonuclease RuvC [Planctomycetota bacterium]
MVRHDPVRPDRGASPPSGPVLGIDPGTRHLGWAVVEAEGPRLVARGFGVLSARANLPVPKRLMLLAEGLRRVVAEHRPAAGALEEAFYGRDARAAQRIGEARGAIHLVLAEAGVPVTGYANNVVKKAVTANGRASKAQVMAMVQRILALPDAVTASDAADALALAICHLQQGRVVGPRSVEHRGAPGLSPRIAEALAREAARTQGAGRTVPRPGPRSG